MWIQKLPEDFMDKCSFAFDTIFVWKSGRWPVYVMDNHLAAAWCWMQECNPDEEYNFMHIDKHSDLKGCGYPIIIDFLKEKPKISFEEYKNITYTTHETFQFFQWDNYIRACHYLFPKWFNTNLFYTHSDNDCTANDWGYEAFPAQTMEALYVRNGITQFIKDKDPFANVIFEKRMRMKKWIVNIDLDFFWDFDGIKVFDDQFIRDFARKLNSAMNNIQVITIALSPDCIGGDCWEEQWKNVIKVLDIMKNEICYLTDCPISEDILI